MDIIPSPAIPSVSPSVQVFKQDPANNEYIPILDNGFTLVGNISSMEISLTTSPLEGNANYEVDLTWGTYSRQIYGVSPSKNVEAYMNRYKKLEGFMDNHPLLAKNYHRF